MADVRETSADYFVEVLRLASDALVCIAVKALGEEGADATSTGAGLEEHKRDVTLSLFQERNQRRKSIERGLVCLQLNVWKQFIEEQLPVLNNKKPRSWTSFGTVLLQAGANCGDV